MPKGGDLTRRDAETGLMPIQQEYLLKLAELGSEKEARQALGLSANRVSRWLREEPAFREIHGRLFQQSFAVAQTRLDALQEKLPDVAEELLEAMRHVTVECPSCGDKFNVSVQNDAVRAKVLEMMMKAKGHLKDIRRVEGGITVTEMTAGQRVAVMRWQRGLELSERQVRVLEELGVLSPEEAKVHRDAYHIFEGEARPAPDDNPL